MRRHNKSQKVDCVWAFLFLRQSLTLSLPSLRTLLRHHHTHKTSLTARWSLSVAGAWWLATVSAAKLRGLCVVCEPWTATTLLLALVAPHPLLHLDKHLWCAACVLLCRVSCHHNTILNLLSPCTDSMMLGDRRLLGGRGRSPGKRRSRSRSPGKGKGPPLAGAGHLATGAAARAHAGAGPLASTAASARLARTRTKADSL